MNENRYADLLNVFVRRSREISGGNLTGIYLHGSAAMGCFNGKKSDIDIIIVVKDSLTEDIKRDYMDMVAELNKQASAKGIEFSIVREKMCNPFVYPTPYELHFSPVHLSWYLSEPEDYIAKMKGTDKDLAAHFMVLSHRGQVLFGKSIREVFGKVSREDYFDSIWHDIENAREEIADNTVYMILNLCRVLAYQQDGLILSKKDGGEWGFANVPEKYRNLISDALKEYQTDEIMSFDKCFAVEYADYMLKRIEGEVSPETN